MEALDAVAIRRWATGSVRALEANREAIDRINVYPVADQDTGTNLLHTLRCALDAAAQGDAHAVGAVTSRLAKGALAGARGNSGVILSQVLRGLAEAWDGVDVVTGADLPDALRRATELATAAVAEPVEGTVLSVLRAASDAVRNRAGSSKQDSLEELVRAAVTAAAQALADTPRQLAALAENGVVDAGGQGLLVLLRALEDVVAERDGEHQVPTLAGPVPRTPHRERFEYEVMYLVDGLADEAGLRGRLSALGDSVAVAGDGDDRWSVHVHCDDVGAAIEAGIELGRPHRITVTRLTTRAVRPDRTRAVLAVVAARGIAELFLAEGAAVLSRPRHELTVGDVVTALTETGAAHVTVLADSSDTVLAGLVAAAVDQVERGGQEVVVVPTASPVQGLAALAVHDPARRPGDDVVAMAEAAAATRRGEVLLAEREAMTWVGRCQPGDALGLLDGEVVLIEPGPAGAETVLATACQLVDRMVGLGGELVTLLVGAAAQADLAARLEEHLRHSHPEVELVAYAGGQPDSLVLIGVE
ncbi:MAG: DAK2 domain-containing protein [Kutzneria sp.]|nr:DAK2 domain-containing protein [Kutzneria sp.]